MMSLHYKNIWLKFFARLLDKAHKIKLQQRNSESSARTPGMSFKNRSLFSSALNVGALELFSVLKIQADVKVV